MWHAAAHGSALWDLFALREEFVSADNEGSIILWTVKDEGREDVESLLEKRVAISGMGSVLLLHFVVCCDHTQYICCF